MGNWQTFKRILYYSKADRRTILLVIVTSILAALLQILSPYILGKILNTMLPGNSMNTNILIVILLIVYVLIFVFSLLQGIGVGKISNRTSTRIREDAFFHMSRLPMSFFDTNSRGEMINLLTNDVEKINQAVQQIFTQIFSGSIILLGSIIAMFMIQPIIALVVLLLTPFTFIITNVIARKSHQYFMDQSRKTAKLQGHAEEMIEGQKLLRVFGGEPGAQETYDQLNQELYVIGKKAQFASSLTNPGTRFVNNVTYVLVGVISSALASLGRLSIGDISAFLNYALQYAKPINELTAVMTQVQEGLASAERIFTLLDEETEPEEKHKQELKLEAGSFQFEAVEFSYVPDKPLIENFSMEILPRQTVAIVGPTGAGKTTIVNLLMRFYQLDSGAIYIDGQDIAQVSRENLRSHFGMVLQETWLFGGSIADNIAYGKEGATREEILDAAKQAHAHNFIMQMPQGYDTKLEDSGDSLSTGQKQLLTIARVMLSKPSLLILDEATSNIDTRTEVLVQESFLRLMEGRTAFIIAHRLSTIREADVILVMHKGQIIETGNHQELMAKKGFYYSLYHS